MHLIAYPALIIMWLQGHHDRVLSIWFGLGLLESTGVIVFIFVYVKW